MAINRILFLSGPKIGLVKSKENSEFFLFFCSIQIPFPFSDWGRCPKDGRGRKRLSDGRGSLPAAGTVKRGQEKIYLPNFFYKVELGNLMVNIYKNNG
jgi:hypothetical protein